MYSKKHEWFVNSFSSVDGSICRNADRHDNFHYQADAADSSNSAKSRDEFLDLAELLVLFQLAQN